MSIYILVSAIALAAVQNPAFPQFTSESGIHSDRAAERMQLKPNGTPGQVNSAAAGTKAECRPSSVNCPEVGSSGSSVISTDSQPIGSTPARDRTISESDYPTSVGSGSMGSGATGSPAGPAPGPVNGIGR